MSSPVAETRTCWASEKNAEHERDHDGAEDQPEPVRSVDRPGRRRGRGGDRASGPSAIRGAARQAADGARACALVDGHRSVAEREADARAARIEERRAGRPGAAEPQSPSSSSKRLGVLAAVVPLAHLVLAAPVGLATAGLVTLAHRGLLLLRMPGDAG